MEISMNDLKAINIDHLKLELQRKKKLMSDYEFLIEQIEVYPKKLKLLKDTIKVSKFYLDIQSKEEFISFMESIFIEKVTNQLIIFNIKDKSGQKTVTFVCSWTYQQDLNNYDISITFHHPSLQEPLQLQSNYSLLNSLLGFMIKPIEYMTVIVAVLNLFDSNNILISYEYVDSASELDEIYMNMFSICHTKKRKRLLV